MRTTHVIRRAVNDGEIRDLEREIQGMLAEVLG